MASQTQIEKEFPVKCPECNNPMKKVFVFYYRDVRQFRLYQCPQCKTVKVTQ